MKKIFTKFGENFRESPNLVKIKWTRMSPMFVKLNFVSIFSPNFVIFKAILLVIFLGVDFSPKLVKKIVLNFGEQICVNNFSQNLVKNTSQYLASQSFVKFNSLNCSPNLVNPKKNHNIWWKHVPLLCHLKKEKIFTKFGEIVHFLQQSKETVLWIF